MDSHPQAAHRLTRVEKRVHFQLRSVLEDVRTIGYQAPHQQQEQQHQSQPQEHTLQQDALRHNIPKGKDKVLSLGELPPLFRCKTYEEICDVINTGKGAIGDIFRGYNALQWYCDAKSTSPGIIQTLLNFGIDINALDQRTRTRGPLIRHTALGYACRNANVKGIHTLLQNDANPCGLVKSGLPHQDARGNPVVYPSPLQELLCQPTHGPRPGKCPWTYHLSEEDEEKAGYLDEDDPERLPEFRALSGLSEDRPICQACAADYHIWEPWPETQEERAAARTRRRACYYNQIIRFGNRLKACVQLLLNYSCSDPLVAFPEYDDPHLWLGIDYLLETFWRFFYPLAICASGEGPSKGEFPTSPEHLTQVLSKTVFTPFGEICDMLLESAGYGGRRSAGETRGQNRLISLIAGHSEFTSFRQGKYFDVDGQLERY
ncbi:hypothetical protein E0Z10_g2865 [Xylaria hypoxylon]|uniref:Uncharacterized protein n=1 Tax=Xylaria hypoxylon TaxID=37992 RepID=A0A4Z0Z4Z4_9PEZI|nr:hypothetical protein E0Z10_g2865 [Xylaria hypoxylon]